MKGKSFFFLILAFFLGFNAYSQYCSVTAQKSDWEYIKEVQFGKVDNSSGSDLYHDYTLSLPAVLYIGEEYPLTIKTASYASTDVLEIYVDWNADSIFSAEEKLNVTFTGEESKEGIGQATLVPTADYEGNKVRLRIVLYDSGSAHDSYSNACGSFEYGEAEDYLFEVKSISTPPEVDFFVDKTSVFTGEVVQFSDNSSLLPTEWEWKIVPESFEFVNNTSATSQNPRVKFTQPGSFTVTLIAANSYGKDSLVKERYIKVKNFSAPKNLTAQADGNQVELTWEKPNIPNWYGYVDNVSACKNLVLTLTDIATKYDDANLDFSFPITIYKLGTVFFNSSSSPWTNDDFKFKIIKCSDNSLIYESPLLPAFHMVAAEHELPSPITINEPFLLVISTPSTDGTPTALAMANSPENIHTVVWNSDTKQWENFVSNDVGYELYTKIYIGHDENSKNNNRSNAFKYPTSTKNFERYIVKDAVTGIKADESPKLQGYLLYRNSILVDSIGSPSIVTYKDTALADGEYTYALKAYYSPSGESVFSNSVTVTVDNSPADIKVVYSNAEIKNNGSLKFPSNVEVNTSRTINLLIKNVGRSELNIDNISLSNDLFEVVDTPAQSISQGQSTELQIKFSPVADGPQSCVVTIATNDPNENPFKFTVNAIAGMAQWTWMIYMLEDNTGLDGVKDINELEVAGSVEGLVNYVVLWDAQNDENDGVWYIKKDSKGFNRTLVSDKIPTDFGVDFNMSYASTLTKFLNWVKDNYPAKHFGLTMWDHGDGIFKSGSALPSIDKGFVGTMKLWQMSDALEGFVQDIGHKIDVIGFDVCLLGQIETAYQFKDLAKYVIASEKTEPGDGWDYANSFQALTDDPYLKSDSIAKIICSTYASSYRPNGSAYEASSTQAVVSVDSLVQVLVPKLDDFANVLIQNVTNYKSEIKSIKDNTYAAPGSTAPLDNPEHRDLGHFAKLVVASSSLPDDLKDAAKKMLSAYEKTVILHEYSNEENANSTGMKIWFPEEVLNSGSATLFYTKPKDYIKFGETKWLDFLKAYQNPPVTEPPKAIFEISATEVAVNNVVVLKDQSLQSPTEWEWTITPSDGVTFQNSTTSQSQNPNVVFTKTGYYTVGLKVTNAFGTDDTVRVNVVKVTNPQLEQLGELKAEVDKNNVRLSWSSEAMFSNDDFESYETFSTSFGAWKQVDRDGSETYGIDGYSWNNAGYTGSFIVFDGNKTTPALQGWVTPSGSQALACFDAITPPNDDWLISAKINVKQGDSLSFFACSLNDNYGLERIQVGISTTGREPEDFTMVSQSPYIEVPATWTKYKFDLAEYVGKDIYICIHVVSNDSWCLFLDDISVGGSEGTSTSRNKMLSVPNSIIRKKAKGNSSINVKNEPSGYLVFRDGSVIAELGNDVFDYTDTGVEPGKYYYYVKSFTIQDGDTLYSTPTNYVEVNIWPTAINAEHASKLQLYPNPVGRNSALTLKVDEVASRWEIYSLSGELKYFGMMDGKQAVVNIPNLVPGCYLIKLYGSRQVYVNKLFVQ
ncbi:clostripain-related cysteine peptidase [Tenuifilum thalassicum]|nr:clostripain-related cysteine peptidase [Tenuifilum thalassicum]